MRDVLSPENLAEAAVILAEAAEEAIPYLEGLARNADRAASRLRAIGLETMARDVETHGRRLRRDAMRERTAATERRAAAAKMLAGDHEPPPTKGAA